MSSSISGPGLSLSAAPCSCWSSTAPSPAARRPAEAPPTEERRAGVQMAATAIILCLGLLLAVAIILPILSSEKAHESLEESGDAGERSGSEDRDAAVPPTPAPRRADQSSGSAD